MVYRIFAGLPAPAISYSITLKRERQQHLIIAGGYHVI